MGDSALASVTTIGFTLAGYAIAGPFGAAVGAGLGAFVANELFGQDIETSRGRIADLKVATSEYGHPITNIWGCTRVGGSAYFNSDLIESVHKETESGKGGQTVKSKTYFYSIDIGYKLAIGPAHFPVVVIPLGWMNGKLVWDFTNETGPIFNAKYVGENGGPFNSGIIRIRFGGEDQLPDPLYEEYAGVGTTPSDRGYATVILEKFPLEDFGNSPPQLNALVCTAETPLYPAVEMAAWTLAARNWFWAPNGRYLLHFGNAEQPQIVNSDTREHVIAPGELTLEPLEASGLGDGDSPVGPHDIDQFGRLLTIDQPIFDGVVPFLHRADTYEVIARGENSGISISSTAARFYGLNDERILIIGTNDQEYSVYNAASTLAVESGVDGYTFTGVAIPFILNASWAASSPTLPICGMEQVAMDEQTGHMWTAHNDGSDVILAHWSLDFSEIERFTVTGRNVEFAGYDHVSHSFYFLDGVTLWRWVIEDEAIFSTVLTISTTNDVDAAFRNGTSNGEIYLQIGSFGPNIQRIDIPTMTLVKTYDVFNNWGYGNLRGYVYDPYLHAVIGTPTSSTPGVWIFLDRTSGDGVTLESILNNEVLLSGYEGGSADADASDHSATTVLGWAAHAQTAVVGESQSQADLYKFGHVETNHKITFPARGRATSFALTDDDLGVVSEGQAPSRKLQITRLDLSGLPIGSEMQFMDPALSYQEGLQRAFVAPETLPGTAKDESRSFRVTMTNEEALRREFLHLTQAFLDQQLYKFTTFHSNMRMDPGDTGTIVADGVTHLVMIEETNLGANFIYECSAVGFAIPTAAEADTILTEAHSQNTSLMAQTPDGVIPEEVGQLNPTTLEMIDAPFMTDAVDTGSEQLANQIVAQRTSVGVPWSGTQISRSSDNTAFLGWHFYTSAFEGEIGRVASVLGDVDRWTVFDDDNTVTVVFRDALVLASVSDAALLNNENAFLIGDEYLLAGTVVDNGSGSWTLSHFLRGRRGTNWAMGSHTGWGRAIYLGTASASDKAMAKGIPISDVNVLYYYKAVSLGAVSDTGTTEQLTNTGRSHMPYSPALVAGTKSGSDWAFTWERRSRTGGELRDFADVPANDPDIYEVDILDEAGTVVRTIRSTASANGSVVSGKTAAYDQLDIEADFSESPVVSSYPLYRLRINVYQLNNDTVGRGFTTDSLVEDFPDPITADASFASVSLLLHLNSLTPRDKSSNKLGTFTVGTDVALTSGNWEDGVSQYGSAVMAFQDAANSEVRLARADFGTEFDFAAGDFTIEAWTRQTSKHRGRIISIWNAGQLEWVLSWNTGATTLGSLQFSWSTDGSAATNEILDIPNDTADFGLNHVAVARDGTTLGFFLNGVRFDTADVTGVTIFSGTTSDLVIGVGHDGADGNNEGDIDSIRITKGVARYSGATYDIPNMRFANT